MGRRRVDIYWGGGDGGSLMTQRAIMRFEYRISRKIIVRFLVWFITYFIEIPF